MIDVFNEEVLSIADAVKRLPKVRNGRRPHISALYRWIKTGSKSADGSLVRLESIKVGGTTCTSLEALQRFFDRLTGEQHTATPPPNSDRRKPLRMSEEEVEAKLKKFGL